MSDVTIKRLGDFENNHGIYYRVRAGLGVSAFGLAVEQWPPGSEDHPEHDHNENGQEEVYFVLEGSCVLRADGDEHALSEGMFARIGPTTRRKILPGADGVKLLCIGGVPGGVYRPPAFTETGASWR